MPIELKRVFRITFRVYAAICVMLTSVALLAYASLLKFDWWTDPNRGVEFKNVLAFSKLVEQSSKSINMALFNNGDWSLICFLGQYASREDVEKIAAAKGLRLRGEEIRQNGFQKSRASLVYIQRDGKVRWSLPEALRSQIAPGETVCLTPDTPNISLPTLASVNGTID
jgi:hypothetical protein